MEDIIKTAEKNSMKDLLEKYNEPFRDIIVIFVTDWQIDAFWKNLSDTQLITVLDKLSEGIKKL